MRLMQWAKSKEVPVFLVGHVTKGGDIAGPKALEHSVDVVLYFEGAPFSSYRLLRCAKNRFGSTNEVGVFEMVEKGLVQVENPSQAFILEHEENTGSAIVPILEGNRPLLIEIQSLATTSYFGLPRRVANGVDFNRLLLIAAVLARRVGLRLGEQDVFVNVVGGIQVEEPAADLAMAAALASSLKDLPVKADTVLIGEVGLSGELRMVGQMPSRLREAANLGFKAAIVPRRVRRGEPWPEGIQVIEARSLRQALDHALVGEQVEKEGAGS
jgi:DNA repair protein RadA/Sms